MNREVIFIGPCGGGKTPINGASIKNFHILKSFDNQGIAYRLIDTEFWKKNPFIILKLVIFLFNCRNKNIVLSANSNSSYILLTVLSLLKHTRIIYWVIGGSLANKIQNGKYKIKPYKNCKHIIVEGEPMKKTLESCGLYNVITVPNFKEINYIPNKNYDLKKESFDMVFYPE